MLITRFQEVLLNPLQVQWGPVELPGNKEKRFEMVGVQPGGGGGVLYKLLGGYVPLGL